MSVDPRKIESLLINEILNDDYKSSLAQIRKSVEAIWSNEAPRIVQGFTDHGIQHSLRLIDYASKLLDANRGDPLSDEEMYLLIAGIYLHDIGMQCDVVKFPSIKVKAIELGASFNVNFTCNNSNQFTSEEQKEIRKNHHYLSAAWISCAYNDSDTALGKSIKSVPPEFMFDLTEICKYHSTLTISNCPIQLKTLTKGRKQLIAALVRFSDELDIGKNRVSIETVKNFQIDDQNALYWWIHGSTHIEITDNILNVKILLQTDDYNIFGQNVKQFFINKFIKKNSFIIQILNQNNIPISTNAVSDVIPDEYVEKLPGAIVQIIKDIQDTEIALIKKPIDNKTQLSTAQCKCIPKPKPYFVGRLTELQDFKAIFECNPCILIEGGGGIGKTQFVSKMIETFEIKDKVIWYECTPTSQPDDVIKEAGYEDFLKGKEKTEREKYSAFKDKIEELQLVVILDNYQDVATNTAFRSFLAFTNEYLQIGHLIVLSRDNIISPQLQPKRFSLKGLGKDSLQHAQKLIEHSYTTLIDTPTETLNTICNKLKGYPLAIDLAIYLLSLNVSVNNILDVAVKESQCEGSEIEQISNRLLNEIFQRQDASEEEKTFLKLLSIFRGKVQNIEVLAIIPEQLFENASRKLLNKNLLEINSNYLELHPLIREFCYKELENKKEIHSKAAIYYEGKRTNQWNSELEEKIFYHLSSAEQWNKISEILIKSGREFIRQGYLNRLQQMIDNVKNQDIYNPVFGIFEGDIAEMQGNWDLALSIFDKVKQSTEEEVKIEGLIKFGEMLFRKGNVKDAQSFFENAIVVTKIDVYKKWYARAQNDLGLVNSFFGNSKVALNLQQIALQIRVELGEQEDIAISFNNIGLIKDDLGFPDEALKLHEKSLKIREVICDKTGIAMSLNNIGITKGNLGFHNEALILHGKSLKINEEIGNKAGIAMNFNNIGTVKSDLGFHNEALILHEKSLKINEEIGNKASIATCLNNIGLIKNALGLPHEALLLYEQSLKIHEEIGNKSGIATILHNIGARFLNNGIEFERACFYLLKSKALELQIGKVNTESKKSYLVSLRQKVGKTKFKEMVLNALLQLDEELRSLINIDELMGEPIIVEKHLGRNDLCLCGSGKKYKKCHGKN